MKNNLTEHVQSIGKEFNLELETIMRGMMVRAYDMGKKQVETPYTYTLDTDSAIKEWKQVKSHLLLSQLKTIELLKEKLERMKNGYIENREKGSEEFEKAELLRTQGWNSALSQAITLLDTIIQEIKIQMK